MKIRYLSYLKGILFPLVFLTLPFALMEQFIFQEASYSTDDRIAYGVVGIILGLIELFLVLTMLGYGIQKNLSLGKYYNKYLKDVSIEILRAMGSTAVGFLLIIPGFVRLVRYFLIPYIVQFDVNYREGKVDALEEAKSLLKGRFLKFFSLVFLTLIVSFVVQIASVKFNLFTTPVAWILFYMAEVLLQTAIFWVFYNYYLNLKQRV